MSALLSSLLIFQVSVSCCGLRVENFSVLNGVNNVMVNQEGSTLQWGQQENVDYPTCIVSYTVSWNGNEFSTGNTSPSATREDLNAAGFPYSVCQNIPITVTPVTPMGPLTGVSAAVDATLVSPGIIMQIII